MKTKLRCLKPHRPNMVDFPICARERVQARSSCGHLQNWERLTPLQKHVSSQTNQHTQRSSFPKVSLHPPRRGLQQRTSKDVWRPSMSSRSQCVRVHSVGSMSAESYVRHYLRWLRRNAQRSEQWCPNGEGASRGVADTSVRGSRSYHAETKSKPACLHRRGTREKSGILNINTPIFLTLPQEQV